MPLGFCKRCQAPIDPFQTLCASCKASFDVYKGRAIGKPCERCGRPVGWDRLCRTCAHSLRRHRG